MPPLLLPLGDGEADEPEPGGHAVLLAPVLPFIAVLLLLPSAVEPLPLIVLQSLLRLELPRVEALPEVPALGAL